MSPELIKEIAVTFELCGGTTLSDPAVDALIDALEVYEEQQVRNALRRCRNEVKHLTQQDIIERIDDGRPGPQEAWAMIPTSESDSVVWTDEMATAYGVVCSMTDRVAARMAFIEAYKTTVQKARTESRPVSWRLSPGSDPGNRDKALVEAVNKGRLTPQRAMMLLSQPEEYASRLLAARGDVKTLPEKKEIPVERRISQPVNIKDELSAMLRRAGF